MTLLTKTGSLSSTSTSRTNNNLVPKIVVKDPSPEAQLLQQEHVKKAYLNDANLVEDRYNQLLQSLRAFTSGATIFVTYYQHMQTTTDAKTEFSDLSLELASNHRGFRQINLFEIKLDGDLVFSAGANGNEVAVTGKGFTYPGFFPHVDDYFIYDIDANTKGCFRLTKTPEPLTISANTWHGLEFDLYKIATPELLNTLQDSVREIAYFNRDRFKNQKEPLITTDEYVLIMDLQNLYNQLKKYYLDNFFERQILQTFIRPDGFYDPYLLYFLQTSIGFDTGMIFPRALLPTPTDIRNSIWYKLMYPTDAMVTVYPNYLQVTHTVSQLSVLANGLINRVYLKLSAATTEETTLYPVQDLTTPVTAFDALLKQYLTSCAIETDNLVTVCKTQKNLTMLEQCYQIPILLFLIKQCLTNLQ